MASLFPTKYNRGSLGLEVVCLAGWLFFKLNTSSTGIDEKLIVVAILTADSNLIAVRAVVPFILFFINNPRNHL